MKRTNPNLLIIIFGIGFCSLESITLGQNPPNLLIGYTELKTNLSGGRHANVRTMRAAIVQADGSNRKLIAEDLAKEADCWTQFAGWSPDGKTAIIYRGWESPENAKWEEEHKTFRFTKEGWLLDSYLVDLASKKATNVTGVNRVSFYNGGLFYMPDGRLGFTPLIDGISKPFVMDLDGKNKKDVSGDKGGFAYGYSASPDGKFISYHENYQIYIANSDGSGKKKIDIGNPFNFGPRWSPDGKWILFLSGTHGHSNPYLVKRDGKGLKKLADLNDYQGWVLFLDVEDFHQGSSDLPVWSTDSQTVFYTAKVDKNVELFQVTLDGKMNQITKSPEGTLYYHIQPSPDGKWLVYGSKRDGIRRLYVMRLSDHQEWCITKNPKGEAAMWPYWQPISSEPRTK
jgi:TolB protein